MSCLLCLTRVLFIRLCCHVALLLHYISIKFYSVCVCVCVCTCVCTVTFFFTIFALRDFTFSEPAHSIKTKAVQTSPLSSPAPKTPKRPTISPLRTGHLETCGEKCHCDDLYAKPATLSPSPIAVSPIRSPVTKKSPARGLCCNVYHHCLEHYLYTCDVISSPPLKRSVVMCSLSSLLLLLDFLQMSCRCQKSGWVHCFRTVLARLLFLLGLSLFDVHVSCSFFSVPLAMLSPNIQRNPQTSKAMKSKAPPSPIKLHSHHPPAKTKVHTVYVDRDSSPNECAQQ